MSNSEQTIEQEIVSKGLTAPRLTPASIDAAIKDEHYWIAPGFTVTGESACASPENFDEELGRKIARSNAREKIWPLEGYLLRQRLHDGV